MTAAAGQAAGLAVGAAVGSVLGQPLAGASIGAGATGLLQERSASKSQRIIDTEALELNRQQARLKAAETSAIHASSYRKALASQISIASMRGGTGSLISQFASDAFKKFASEQRAIDTGLSLSEVQSGITQAGIDAKRASREITALTRFASSSLSGINLNNLTKPRGE